MQKSQVLCWLKVFDYLKNCVVLYEKYIHCMFLHSLGGGREKRTDGDIYLLFIENMSAG